MNPAPALDPQAVVAGAVRNGLAHTPEMLGDIWRATFPALFWIGGGWLWRLNRGALAGAGVALVVSVERDFGLYAGFVVETLLLVGLSLWSPDKAGYSALRSVPCPASPLAAQTGKPAIFRGVNTGGTG